MKKHNIGLEEPRTTGAFGSEIVRILRESNPSIPSLEFQIPLGRNGYQLKYCVVPANSTELYFGIFPAKDYCSEPQTISYEFVICDYKTDSQFQLEAALKQIQGVSFLD
ncbi:MAG: hypothetical protein MAG795_00481 [Candidatus Woesearchaeota archaeon]|nr:hypothetical protein [Candidatus Woesearchaeota archaeon]